MKKLNNKGFAITGILYSLLILVILLMFLIIMMMATRRVNLSKVINDAIKTIDERLYVYKSVDDIDDPVVGAGPFEFLYTGSCESVQLEPGKYKLEVWGAQGGSYQTTTLGGNGGYSTGILTLTSTELVWVCVGEQPKYDAYPTTAGDIYQGGFNGGGNGVVHRGGTNANYSMAMGGGGATDIRIGTNSYNHRVIVAGGGTGAVRHSGSSHQVGYAGGGLPGQTGTANYAGTINNSGTAVTGTATTLTAPTRKGAFGIGGSAENAGGSTSSSNYQYGPGGAGGGWYGGSVGTSGSATGNRQQQGGGSGWVYTQANYTSWTTTADKNSWGLNSNYYLTQASTVAGNTSNGMPNKETGANTTGNTGNGYARITPIYEFEYTGNCEAVPLAAGEYKLEVWGAQGGSLFLSTSTTAQTAGGNGGYSTGILKLTSTEIVWVCVGGQPTYGSHSSLANYRDNEPLPYKGGFNGGGAGTLHRTGTSANYSIGLGGGGATDIRIGINSYYHRVIVAGGGTGAVRHSGSTHQVGYAGGGLPGQTGSANFAGTISNGGTGTANANGRGVFGEGGSAIYTGTTTNTSNHQYGPAGAGGGWYGGSVGVTSTGTSTSGAAGTLTRQQMGGGSGWFYTATNYTNWNNTTDKPLWGLTSNYYLTQASTIAGNNNIPHRDTGANTTGNTGNGFARIMKIG